MAINIDEKWTLSRNPSVLLSLVLSTDTSLHQFVGFELWLLPMWSFARVFNIMNKRVTSWTCLTFFRIIASASQCNVRMTSGNLNERKSRCINAIHSLCANSRTSDRTILCFACSIIVLTIYRMNSISRELFVWTWSYEKLKGNFSSNWISNLAELWIMTASSVDCCHSVVSIVHI